MTSTAQIAANRRNAQRSTGPKTEAGRAAASGNALRHGLTARQLVLHDESQADFEQFRGELGAALDPADGFEAELVLRIVLCAWRLRRAARIEADLISKIACDAPWDGAHVSASFDHAPQEMAALQRYEAALERALHRAEQALERRQTRRREAAMAQTSAEPAPAESEICETKPIAAPETAPDGRETPLDDASPRAS